MLPVNILEPIINASQISADRFLKVAGYDKTLECTILRRDENNPEIYYVSTTGFSSLMVYAQKNAPIYAIGSTVLVNVPEGNFDGEKTIIGEVVDKNTRYKINDPADDFVPLRIDDKWEIDYDKNLIEEDKIYPPFVVDTNVYPGFFNIAGIRTNVALIEFTVNITRTKTNKFYQIVDANKKFITFNISYVSFTNPGEPINKCYYWSLSNYFGNIDSNSGITKKFSFLSSVPDGYCITGCSLQAIDSFDILNLNTEQQLDLDTIETKNIKINIQCIYGFLKSKIEAQKMKNGLYLDFCFQRGYDPNGICPVVYDTIQEKYCSPSLINRRQYKRGPDGKIMKDNNGKNIVMTDQFDNVWKDDFLWLLGHNYYQDYTNFQADFIRYDEVKDIEELAYTGNDRSHFTSSQTALTKTNDINQMIPTSFFYRITAEHLTRKNNNLLIESKKIELKE